MTETTIKQVGVIGAGQMGSGIAQVCAASGYSVVLFDVQGAQTQKAQDSIFNSCEKFLAE